MSTPISRAYSGSIACSASMKAHTPPSFWASAMMWYISVVLPEDSGPKTSTIRPRGTPPMPSARSSDSAPVGIALTLTWAPSSPMRMMVPLPNSRSICESAPCSAVSRALAAFSSGGAGIQAPRSSRRLVQDRTVAVGRKPRPYGGFCHRGTCVRVKFAACVGRISPVMCPSAPDDRRSVGGARDTFAPTPPMVVPHRAADRAQDDHDADGDEPRDEREHHADLAVELAVGDQRRGEQQRRDGREADPQRGGEDRRPRH